MNKKNTPSLSYFAGKSKLSTRASGDQSRNEFGENVNPATGYFFVLRFDYVAPLKNLEIGSIISSLPSS